MRSTLAFGLLALAGYAAAQDQPQDNYPYTINPDDVPQATRDTWCNNQKSQCPLICYQQPGVTSMNTVSNECDPDTLVYSCVCDNNVAPNITQFSQTIPYYVCTEWGNECVANCGQDNTCADACRADHPCGAQKPYKPNNTVTSTTMAPTGSQTGQASKSIPITGLLGATATGQPGAAPPGMNLGVAYGMAVLMAGVGVGFALL